MKTILNVSDATVRYGQTEALTKVNIKVSAGSVTTVLGANGAGKSTLLKSIIGLVKSKQGSILFENESLESLKTFQRISKGLSLSPEGRLVFPDLSISDNLMLGAYTIKDKKWTDETLDFIFTLFPVLRDRRFQSAGSLSGGEQQMLAIGRALMSKPSLLLLDEPSLGIAPILVEKIFDSIKLINKRGLSVLLVEQNAMAALEISDYGYVLENGSVVLEGPASQLVSDKRVQESYLGG